MSETGYVRLVANGFVKPGTARQIMGGIEGKILQNGVLDIANQSLRLKDRDAIEPGTEVYVKRFKGMEWCIPLEEYKQKQYEKKAEQHLEHRKHQRKQNQKRRDAERFWKRYDIPFDHDVAIKGRLSGLTRGSNGNGRDKRTVNHLYVLEPFEEGRLSRPNGTYLCKAGASFEFKEERALDGGGNEYVPEVTCKACQELMQRWKSTPSQEV